MNEERFEKRGLNHQEANGQKPGMSADQMSHLEYAAKRSHEIM